PYQFIRHLARGPPFGRFPVNGDYLVPIADSRAPGRGPIERRYYIDLAVALIDVRPYARITAALLVLEFFPFLTAEIRGMRIKRVQHSRNRRFGQFIKINLAGVVVFRSNNGVSEIFIYLRP